MLGQAPTPASLNIDCGFTKAGPVECAIASNTIRTAHPCRGATTSPHAEPHHAFHPTPGMEWHATCKTSTAVR